MLPEMLQEHAVAALGGLLRSLELLADLSAHGKVRQRREQNKKI